MHDESEFAAPREAIHTAINDHAPTVGPEGVTNPVCGEWLLLTSWTDLDTGRAILCGLTSENLLTHHREGLLHVGLYGGLWTDGEDI